MVAGDDFRELPRDAPLDIAAAIRAIPPDATIRGMFIERLLTEAAAVGATLRGARDHYIPFEKYTLREHVDLLLEIVRLFQSKTPPRLALRRLGRAAPKAFLDSTLGRVMLGSVEGVHASVEAMANAYTLSLDPGRGEVIERGDRHIIVHLEEIHYFLDSHHVGTFEGVMWAAGVSKFRIRIRAFSEVTADLRIDW